MLYILVTSYVVILFYYLQYIIDIDNDTTSYSFWRPNHCDFLLCALIKLGQGTLHQSLEKYTLYSTFKNSFTLTNCIVNMYVNKELRNFLANLDPPDLKYLCTFFGQQPAKNGKIIFFNLLIFIIVYSPLRNDTQCIQSVFL